MCVLILFYTLCLSPGGMYWDMLFLLEMMDETKSRETEAMAKFSLANLEHQKKKNKKKQMNDKV